MGTVLEKINKVIDRPSYLLEVIGRYGIYDWISDEVYLKFMYHLKMGKKLNLDNPQTFNEKLQWLKLHDRRPEYTQMVDKYAVREYIKEKLGEEYLIPLLGVWDDPDDIDFDELPNQFVLKCTHDSGGLVICKDKSKLDIETVRKKLKKGLKEDYYLHGREWPYKDVPRKIIAEKYMEDESGELRDYKFFCFDGNVQFLFIATDRTNPNAETKFDFFDMDFRHLPFLNGHPNSSMSINRPKSFNEMVRVAALLSKGIPHVRVDLYEINGKVYFGELTFTHWSGMVPFEPEEWDYKLGELIDLEKVKCEC